MTAVQLACFLALLFYVLLIALVFHRAWRRPTARYFLLYLAGMTVWQAGQALVAFTDDANVALTGYRLVAAFAPSFGVFYAMFVRELLDIQSGRWLIRIGLGLVFISPIYALLGGPEVISGVYRESDASLWLPHIGLFPTVLGAVVYGYLVYGLIHLIAAYDKSSSPVERNRLVYLSLGVPVVIVGSAMNYIEALRGYPIDTTANLLNAALTAFAILRYRLLDIQVVVRKGLRYSIITVIVGTVYFLLLSLTIRWLHPSEGYQFFLLSVALAGVAAVAMQPLRDALQNRVDRLFFREKYDAAQMLQRLSSRAASLLDVGELTELIVAEVGEVMHIERLAFFLKDDDGGYSLAAAHGLPTQHGWRIRPDHPLLAYLGTSRQAFLAQNLDRLPLARAFRLEEREQWEQLAADLLIPVATKDALVGVLALGPRRSGVEYSDDDQRVLLTVANQTAVAVENGRLYASAQHELTERRRAEERILESLHEKEVLLKEIHHRVKNNLQVIYSLLNLQAQYAQDPQTLEALRDSQDRIRSMALIHEKLYQSANLADIDFGEYLRSLASHLHRSYASSDRTVRLVVETAPIRLPLDTALPCALIASELISNALKHAFVGRREGILRVRIGRQPGVIFLEVADDGVGMPQAGPADGKDRATLGMHLVRGLVRQLDGNLVVTNGTGTRFVVCFKGDEAEPASP